MTTKTVADILDDAASVLETRGFTTGYCYNPDTGGFCALGAIARAAYPRAKDDEIDHAAYTFVDDSIPVKPTSPAQKRYVSAVTRAAMTIMRKKTLGEFNTPGSVVYGYNDEARSPKQVVKMLRRAAQKEREAVSA